MNIIREIFRKENSGALSLGILAFEGFGIRLLDGVLPSPIVWWTGLLLIINANYVLKLKADFWIKICSLLIVYYVFNILKGIVAPIFMVAAWFSAVFVLSRYISNTSSFIKDMRRLTNFCLYYHLLHIPFLLICNHLPTVVYGRTYVTLLHLFWYVGDSSGGFEQFRICGFAWEPSCWNVLVNLNLVFVLYFSEEKKNLFLTLLCAITTFSTTAFVTMVAIISLHYLQQTGTKGFFRKIVFGVLILALVAPVAYENFTAKMETGSGQARGGDFVVARAVLSHNPLWGEDISKVSELSYAMKERDNYWTAGYDGNQEMVAGMTNGLAGLFVEWGAVLGCIILLLSYNTTLFDDVKLKRLVLMVIVMVMMGSPIARTGFFYLYPLSTVFLKSKKNKAS